MSIALTCRDQSLGFSQTDDFLVADGQLTIKPQPSDVLDALVVAQLRRQGLQMRYATRLGRWLEVGLDLSVALQDLRALMAPLEQKAHTGLKLRARTFESSEAAQTDTVSWCMLILRRCTHEALKPWL